MKYTKKQIEEAIDNYINLVIEELPKSDLGVGEAVDLTATLLKKSEAQKSADIMKKNIMRFLEITYSN